MGITVGLSVWLWTTTARDRNLPSLTVKTTYLTCSKIQVSPIGCASRFASLRVWGVGNDLFPIMAIKTFSCSPSFSFHFFFLGGEPFYLTSGIRSREGVYLAMLLVWFFFEFLLNGGACAPVACWFGIRFSFPAVYLLLSVLYNIWKKLALCRGLMNIEVGCWRRQTFI